MGQEDDHMAEIDAELRVRGVDSVQVVDANIMPKLIDGYLSDGYSYG